MSHATSTDLGNIAAIMDNVISVAATHSGVGWQGQTEWDMPASDEVTGIPWLAVPWPEMAGYSVAYSEQPVDYMERSMEVQFHWDVEVYCLAPYGNGNPLNKKTVGAATMQLVSAFTLYDDLNGSCDEVRPGKPRFMKIGPKAQGPPATPESAPGAFLWFAGMLPLRIIETINTDYTRVA